MITVEQLARILELRQLTQLEVSSRPVRNGCVCDLLSWVMTHGEKGAAWITVQTHLNVVAVACLHDFACVIVPEGIQVPELTVRKANEEHMPLLSSTLPAYSLCCGLCSLGIGC